MKVLSEKEFVNKVILMENRGHWETLCKWTRCEATPNLNCSNCPITDNNEVLYSEAVEFWENAELKK